MTTCPEKLRLLNEYNEAAAAYSEALTALVERRHGSEDGAADFEALLAATQEARHFLQHARKRYEQHLAVDGC
jgi:hypothetical protein